jgi:shikimate dehydrogenase
MAKNFKSELVACFGQPVSENPTGEMQEAAFQKAGMAWRYLTIEVAPENLEKAVNGARAMGWQGFNCTIPHKVAVIPLLDSLSREAELIGAVNTVRRDGDKFIGENTDGKGFLRGVRQDANIDPQNKRVVLLGAGGAARAIATELLLSGVADLLVLNRTIDRGAAMVADLAAKTGGPIRFEPWLEKHEIPASTDILVNATSIGLYPDVDAMPSIQLGNVPAHCLVCDTVFNPPETRLLAAARARGLPVLDGLSMPVYQGVTGFQLWTGQDPDEAAMKAALRTALDV